MQDSSELVVAATGHVRVANLADDPTMPADNAAPTAAVDDFLDLGYTTEDGVTFTATPNVEDINAWQKSTPVRRLVTARSLTVAFSLEQWNQETIQLAYGGGTWSQPSNGIFRFDPPGDNDALSEWALVVDFADGDRNSRFVIKRCESTEAVETQLTRTGAAVLPITLDARTPDGDDRSWYFVGDDAAALAFAS